MNKKAIMATTAIIAALVMLNMMTVTQIIGLSNNNENIHFSEFDRGIPVRDTLSTIYGMPQELRGCYINYYIDNYNRWEHVQFSNATLHGKQILLNDEDVIINCAQYEKSEIEKEYEKVTQMNDAEKKIYFVQKDEDETNEAANCLLIITNGTLSDISERYPTRPIKPIGTWNITTDEQNHWLGGPQEEWKFWITC